MTDTSTKTAVPVAAERPLFGFGDAIFEPLARLRGEVDRLFDDFPLRAPALRFGAGAMTVPPLEMTETKRAYKITAELPGIDAKDVEVSIEDGMLRIAGEKTTEREEDEKGYRLSERSYGAFERLVRLPADADPEKIKAKAKDGVLTITLPKNGKRESARKIAVQS